MKIFRHGGPLRRLEISDPTVDLANRLNVDLNRHSFAETQPFKPVSTSRPGVYACGVFQEPKDIPSSVTEASAAACLAGGFEAKPKHPYKKREIPDEID